MNNDNNNGFTNNDNRSESPVTPGSPASPAPASPAAAAAPAPPSNSRAGMKDRVFSPGETLFAWACILLGYIFCRAFPVFDNTLGGVLSIVLLFGVTLVMLISKGKKPGLMGTLSLICGGVGAAAIFLSSNAFLDLAALAFCIVIYDYFVYISCGRAISGGFSDFILFDFFRAAVSLPASAFGRGFFRALGNKSSRSGKNLLKIIAGLALAIIPTAVILALLSYDDNFTKLLGKIFDFDFSNIISHIFSLLVGTVLGMYVFGLYIASSGNFCSGENAERIKADTERRRALPVITATAAVLPILAVYVIFFISQWDRYTSAFRGTLPEGTIYSEYAREGFFQLCAVSAINFAIVVIADIFVSRKGRQSLPAIIKILTSLLAVSTLILMCTAMSKLILYIKMFGLTPRRVYAGWFMCLLALLLVTVLAGQLIKRFKAIPICVIVSVLMFALLSLSGTDSLIAKYNVDRYLDGSLSDVDVEAMVELGDSGLPELIRLANELDKKNGTDLKAFVYRPGDGSELSYGNLYSRVCSGIFRYAENYEDKLFSMNLPRILAKRALDEAGIKTGERESKLYWSRNSNQTVNCKIEGDEVKFFNTFNFVNYGTEDITFSVALSFPEQSLDGWMEYRDSFDGLDKDGSVLVKTVPAKSDITVDVWTAGRYLGGSTPKRLPDPALIVTCLTEESGRE